MKRKLMIGLMTTALLTGCAWATIVAYLHSQAFVRLVVKKLETVYGGQVAFGSIDVGLMRTSIHGLVFYEDGAHDGRRVWLSINTLTVEDSLWRLASGDLTQAEVKLQVAKAILRLDQDGHILTRLPPTRPGSTHLPHIILESGQVAIAKTGQADYVIQNVQAEVKENSGRLSARATIADPDLGEAHLQGSANLDFSAIDGQIDVAGLKVHDLPEAFNIPMLVRKGVADGRLFGSAQVSVVVIPARVDATYSASVVSMAAAPGWLVPVSALADQPATQFEVRGQGKGQVRDPSGQFEPMDFDWSIAPEGEVKPVSTSRNEDVSMEQSELAEWRDGQGIDLGLGSEGRPSAPLPPGVLAERRGAGRQSVPLSPGTPGERDRGEGGQGAALWHDALALILSFPPHPQPLSPGVPGERGATSDCEVCDAIAPPILKPSKPDQFCSLEVSETSEAAEANTMPAILLDALVGTLFDIMLQEKKAPPIPKNLDLNFKLHNIELAELAKNLEMKLPMPMEGKVSVQIKASLPASAVAKLPDLTAMTAEGTIQSEHITAMGVNLDKLAVDIKVRDGVLSLAGFQALLEGKPLVADAEVRMKGDYPFSAKLAWKQGNLVVLKGVIKALNLPIATVAGSIDIAGTASGSLRPLQFNAAMNAKVQKLKMDAITADDLQGSVDYADGLASYKLQGKMLGGTIDAEGHVPVSIFTQPKKAEANKGHLRIKNVELGPLARSMQVPETVSLSGRASLDLEYEHRGPGLMPKGQGRLETSALRLNERMISTGFRGQLDFSPTQIRLTDFRGDLADGTVSLRAAYAPGRARSGNFALSLDRIDVALLLAPWFEHQVAGLLRGRVTGNLGSECWGEANLTFDAGKMYGLQVTDWQIPASWSFSPVSKRAQLDIHDSVAMVGRGRVRGQLALMWDHGARVDGKLQLTEADMQSLLQQTVGSTSIGGGRLNATVEIVGNQVLSLNDLRGTVTATFKQAQALQMPIFQQLAPFLGVGTSTTFQTGFLQGRIERGALRISQLALQGSNLQVFATGAVALAGNLDLSVMAQLNTLGLPTARLQLLGVRIPIAGPPPLLLIQEVTNLLSNQLIYLQVRGTIRSPVIQPRPLPLLTEEAVRYFLNRTTLPIVP